MAKVRVGLSGWSYDGWRGDFYPADLPRGDELAYVGRHFDTAEINATFYSLRRPRPSASGRRLELRSGSG